MGLARERLPRGDPVGLPPERPRRGPAPPLRRGPGLPLLLSDLVGTLRGLPGPPAGLALLRWFEGNARPPCLGQADGDGLLRRAGAVLPLANVIHLLVDEFTRCGRRALSLPEVLLRLFHSSLLGHDEISSVAGGWESAPWRARVRDASRPRQAVVWWGAPARRGSRVGAPRGAPVAPGRSHGARVRVRDGSLQHPLRPRRHPG